MDRTQEQPRLTFSQRNGLEPLPRRLALGELDEQARNILHAVIHRILVRKSNDSAVQDGPFRETLKNYYVEVMNGNLRNFNGGFSDWADYFAVLFLKMRWNIVMDSVEFFAAHLSATEKVIPLFQAAFLKARIAYLMDDTGQIVPIASPEEGMVIQESLRLTRQEGMQAVRGHLLSAGKYIDHGEWRDSVRESIHAVEAVGRLILKNPSATLGDFIKSCDKRVNIHPQLKEMLKKFSAYANDHARHADKPDSSTPPDMADAVLLFGSCASFVTYLINKSGLNGAAEVS